MIYFIQGENSKRVKIGYSDDPNARLLQLQTGSPELLTLIGTIDGEAKDEKTLHSYFADSRCHGEWFEGTPLLLFVIKVLSINKKLLETSYTQSKALGFAAGSCRAAFSFFLNDPYTAWEQLADAYMYTSGVNWSNMSDSITTTKPHPNSKIVEPPPTLTHPQIETL